MKKDPAFLFYSKDWISGTAELMPEEKGVYIDLLVYHHQSGSLPKDVDRLARIVGLSKENFSVIWESLLCKFYEEDGRLYNGKMVSVMGDRAEKGTKNRINGTLAAVMRLQKLTPDVKAAVYKDFDLDEFRNIPTKQLTERLSEWLTDWLGTWSKDVGNGNANIDKKKKRGVGGKGNIDRKKFNPPTLDDVMFFFKENGYKESEAIRAYNHYTEADWHDTYGKPVLNWKQKVRTNWFRDENKIVVAPTEPQREPKPDYSKLTPKEYVIQALHDVVKRERKYDRGDLSPLGVRVTLTDLCRTNNVPIFEYDPYSPENEHRNNI